LKPVAPATLAAVIAVFLAGFASHILYQRWNPPLPVAETASSNRKSSDLQNLGLDPQSFRVTFVPLLPSAEPTKADLPSLPAREVEKIRRLAGAQARIRGRVFRVGHSAKTNTYFLNFGPSREALTAVIFASAAELFEKNKLQPKSFEGKDVELKGQIKDHPQYGLELILENPADIKVLD
jgi:hypothetical protein